MEKITENTQYRQHTTAPATLDPAKVKFLRPSNVIPRLSEALYRALSKSWKCDTCPGTHRAKICLQGEHDLHRKPDPDSVKYKILFSTPHGDPAVGEQWRETTVTMKCFSKKGKVGFRQNGTRAELVKNICSAVLNHCCRRGNKICFTAEILRRR